MKTKELAAIADAVQTGAPSVIGYGERSQSAFDHGYNCAMEKVYAEIIGLGLEPMLRKLRGLDD